MIGGPGAFLVTANGFGDFGAAIRRKLILEIAGQPKAPGTLIHTVQARTRIDCGIGERLFREHFG